MVSACKASTGSLDSSIFRRNENVVLSAEEQSLQASNILPRKSIESTEHRLPKSRPKPRHSTGEVQNQSDKCKWEVLQLQILLEIRWSLFALDRCHHRSTRLKRRHRLHHKRHRTVEGWCCPVDCKRGAASLKSPIRTVEATP